MNIRQRIPDEIRELPGAINDAAKLPLKIMRIGSLIFGIFIFAVCTWITASQFVLMTSGETAQGKVVALVPKQMEKAGKQGGTETVYAPTIKFIAADGKEYSFTDTTSTDFPPAVGQTETVVYDKADPNQAVMRSMLSLWLMPVSLLLLAFVLFIPSLFFGFIVSLFSWAISMSRSQQDQPPQTPSAS